MSPERAQWALADPSLIQGIQKINVYTDTVNRVYSLGRRGMIVDFGDQRTEDLFHGRPTRRFPPNVRNAAFRKLDILKAAHDLRDLRALPGSRLEALKGKGEGRYSIRINDQWRIVFEWRDGNAHSVKVEDYH